MRKPTLDEYEAYFRVQQYLRWYHPRSEGLTDADTLIHDSKDALEFGDITGWNVYVAGYFNAARALLESSYDRFFMTFAIYPILFLFRHYIELELKGQMMATGKLLHVPLPEFSTDHSILSLWAKFKAMLPAGHPALDNAPNIERILNEMHCIDPKSMDTRYGLRRDLVTPSVANPVRIDAVNLKQTMDKLHSELSTLEIVVEYTR